MCFRLVVGSFSKKNSYGTLGDLKHSHRFRTVVGIARVHLSQQKFVHSLRAFGPPISIDITGSSERRLTNDAYAKVNCDAASFIGDVGLIA